MEKQRIIAVHLLNDFSGSPFVFCQALQALQKGGKEVHLFTATPGGKGFLNNAEGVFLHPVFYRWSNKKWQTLLLYLYSQLVLFFRLLFFVHRHDLVYVNSLLPFGAALAGRLRACKVVYHIHEVSIKPALLKRWLLWVVKRTAQQCIYVSEYLREHTPVAVKSTVIYNALPPAFVQKAGATVVEAPATFTVLMLCSLKKYKGVEVFVEAARRLPRINFRMVLNTTQAALDAFFEGQQLPPNLELFPAQANVHSFYASASVVVNLSLPDQWVETFGMTILEAMYYHKPVIVPPAGGVRELVENGVNGLWADSRDINAVVKAIKRLAKPGRQYEHMSHAAFRKAQAFTSQAFARSVTALIEGIQHTKRFAQTPQPVLNKRLEL